MDNLKPALKGQFHAALDMLKGAIEECPDALWVGGVPPRSFWRLVYHTLFFTHLCLQVQVPLAWSHEASHWRGVGYEVHVNDGYVAHVHVPVG